MYIVEPRGVDRIKALVYHNEIIVIRLRSTLDLSYSKNSEEEINTDGLSKNNGRTKVTRGAEESGKICWDCPQPFWMTKKYR